MELKVVRYEVADRVATITLNRPDRLESAGFRGVVVRANQYGWAAHAQAR